MTTEITDKETEKACGRVFYDAACPFCATGVARCGGAFARRGFVWLPLQTPGTAARLDMSESELFGEMKLELADGRVIGGADAWAALFRSVWWLWLPGVLMTVPGLHAMARASYRWLVRNRYCFGGACGNPRRSASADWLPLVVLPAAALTTREHLPAWAFMWLVVYSLLLGCKWLTWRRAENERLHASAARSLGYLLAWPGMDAAAFLSQPVSRPPTAREWFWGALNLATGFALLTLAAACVLTTRPMLNGWLAMIGLTLILHFGWFELLARVWQRAGVNATPLMRSPLRARSVADFWGARWNTAFSDFVYDLILRPLTRQVGVVAATLAVFLASGLLHDLAISVPAGGGYGLPTAYFILQGVAVLFERSKAGRRLGLGRGLPGWAFTVLVTAGPAYWLFHPAFVRNVILPMLHPLGAK
ncbi:MAG: DUF393 domain-containing protein [Verrucomicrobia bacterium]|nr:DUF393 domain-containing protein [Verrucomicrobiota bacterium]